MTEPITHSQTGEDPCRGKPWYCHVPLIDQVVESWNEHPVKFTCTVAALVLGTTVGVWSLWANYADTFGKLRDDATATAEREQDLKAQEARDASLAGNFDDVQDNLSRVAEVTDTGISEVGAKVNTVLSRIDEGNTNTAQLNERLEQLAASGQVLVTLTPEKLAQLRTLDQPRLRLFWYDDNNSRIAFDDTAPEFRPGQSLHVEFVDAPGAAPSHKYLLVIKGNGDVQLHPDELVNSPDVRGDWEIDPGYDNESLLVLAADHELTGAEQEGLVASLRDSLPDAALPIRRNMIYEWRNGEIYQIARANETRDLKRNPNAPADWVDEVNRSLADHRVSFHGFTYPVNDESP